MLTFYFAFYHFQLWQDISIIRSIVISSVALVDSLGVFHFCLEEISVLFDFVFYFWESFSRSVGIIFVLLVESSLGISILSAVFFTSHSDIFRFLEHFFCLFCVGICRVFPVILIFHPESFTFCGCRLSFFYRLFRHFSVLGAFFLPVLCRRLLCFFP